MDLIPCPYYLWTLDNPDPTLAELLARYREVDAALAEYRRARPAYHLLVAQRVPQRFTAQDRLDYLVELGVLTRVWRPVEVVV